MLSIGKRIWLLGTAFVSVAGLAAGQGTSMPVLFPQVQTFGMVGLTEGQTARLNLLNPGVLPPLATGAICSVQASFLDSKGTVLKTAPLLVPPGQSVPFDLDRDTDLTTVADQRVQIRATLQTPAPSPVFANPIALFGCPLIPTLEIFNKDTGRTQVVLTETRSVFGPVPLPASTAPMNP
jgi:hypothetical protein